jgi:hypothetical protein
MAVAWRPNEKRIVGGIAQNKVTGAGISEFSVEA